MPRKDKPNYTELTHQVVRESPEPLSFNEILRRVHAITPIRTKNPKNTIRGAISQSRLIVATGDGRYGWMLRILNGVAIRLTLSDSDVAGQAVEFGEELREALWPTFFEIQKREDRNPVRVLLPDKTETRLPLDFLGQARWGTSGSPEFWKWFKTLKARRGDHLIFHVADGEARLYRVEFQARAARGEGHRRTQSERRPGGAGICAQVSVGRTDLGHHRTPARHRAVPSSGAARSLI